MAAIQLGGERCRRNVVGRDRRWFRPHRKANHDLALVTPDPGSDDRAGETVAVLRCRVGDYRYLAQ
jgi:hypothetical protein